MNQVFDPFNLIILAIALVVFWRLKSVLGSRTGHERPPFDPYATGRKSDAPASPDAANANVLRFPKEAETPEQAAGAAKEAPLPIWAGYAPEGSAAAQGLERLVSADPQFSPKSFIDGAKLAYEMIVDAFARGDKAALKGLLAREVYDGFARAIDAREAEGQKLESRFVGIDKAEIAAAELTGKRAGITVKFVSEFISATLSKAGAVIEGDPKQVREITDVWTFEREIGSRDPNWKLAATEVPA
ncbi:MAG: Tim44/TimA family putative adaptor protein [Hyphomicrobiales bacterium]